MALKLMFITNNPDIATIAETCGADWIFIDLEIMGKAERQGHLNTVISMHNMSDVKTLRQKLKTSQLLVRVNPVHKDSAAEIGQVLEYGADIVMLPFFTSADEVETFLELVAGRAKTCLLCETPGAVSNIDKILELPGIDFIHIGLNDLHLGYGMKFMFEPLTDGKVERLSLKFKEKGIRFGFGGIAGLGTGTLPAENIIAEHYRLGSEMAILSRSFCNCGTIENPYEIEEIFCRGIREIRQYEAFLQKQKGWWFERNRIETVKIVQEIMQKMAVSYI
jgi:hypothetical protein